MSEPGSTGGATGRLVVLVGLMGTGKTTIGRRLAEVLGCPFLDSDRLIEAETGRTVRQLWLDGGEEAYRARERRTVLDAVGGAPAVLAAPGGIVEDDEVVTALSDPGITVVYLRSQPATIVGRLGDETTHRPLIDGPPADLFAELFARRDPRYAALADLVIDVDDVDPDAAAATIAEGLRGSDPSSP